MKHNTFSITDLYKPWLNLYSPEQSRYFNNWYLFVAKPRDDEDGMEDDEEEEASDEEGTWH